MAKGLSADARIIRRRVAEDDRGDRLHILDPEMMYQLGIAEWTAGGRVQPSNSKACMKTRSLIGAT